MTIEDTELDDELGAGENPPEESGNRLFLIIAGILGGIAILTLICIATYALVYLPRVKQAQESNKATVDAQNTQVAVIIEQTRTAAAIAAFTDTPTSSPVPPTVTETLVPTQVVAVATTPVSPFFTFPPETATALALLETLNAVPGTPTQSQRATGTPQLSNTGIADEFGLPVLLSAAVILILVFVVARRLRVS